MRLSLNYALQLYDLHQANYVLMVLISHHQRTPLSQLIESWFRFRFEMVRYLVDRGADVNTKDEIFVSEYSYY